VDGEVRSKKIDRADIVRDSALIATSLPDPLDFRGVGVAMSVLMRRVFPFVLTVVLGCSILSKVQSADKRLTLDLEDSTTLRVGELAVLEIPSDRGYSDSKIDGAWSDVLTRIGRSGRKVTFRAVKPGVGVIILVPRVPNGECISCATLHYFIEVVPHGDPARPEEPVLGRQS
jgi:hypothetical protein